MSWLVDHWWIILVFLLGIVLNGIKELRRLDHKSFLESRFKLPPHQDNNAQWDEEENDKTPPTDKRP